MTKLWSGRFSLEQDELADLYNTSLPIDKNLYSEDITASIAHAKMLAKCKILPENEVVSIIDGLKTILVDIETKKLIIEDAEDIHMFVEAELTKRIGAVGKKLHTARSRNDQVVTDFKLYIKKANTQAVEKLKELISVLIKICEHNLNTIMPGFTHMQKAQPITLAHHLMAYCEMFYRDITRFLDADKRLDYCPLGSSALAGTTYDIDRDFVAKELGFNTYTNNSMDGVSDRDYVLDYLYNATTTFIHLSRFAEEIIMWASNEYRFIEISDAYSTGSSIMPQKKNPDMAELIRGKSGKALGNLVAMATILKGLPLAYNKDLQEDKSIFFDTEENLLRSIVIMTKMLDTSKFNEKIMEESAKKGFTNATDVADYLVCKGLPFRDAHAVSGKLVAYCILNDKFLEELSISVYKQFSHLFEEDLYNKIALHTLINGRNSDGGTSPVAVKKSLNNLISRLEKI